MSTSVKNTPQSTGGNNLAMSIVGFALVVALAFVARWLKYQVYGAELPFGIPGKVLEYPLWAALIGLVANGILKALNLLRIAQSWLPHRAFPENWSGPARHDHQL